jgi:hypothetical protein
MEQYNVVICLSTNISVLSDRERQLVLSATESKLRSLTEENAKLSQALETSHSKLEVIQAAHKKEREYDKAEALTARIQHEKVISN